MKKNSLSTGQKQLYHFNVWLKGVFTAFYGMFLSMSAAVGFARLSKITPTTSLVFHHRPAKPGGGYTVAVGTFTNPNSPNLSPN